MGEISIPLLSPKPNGRATQLIVTAVLLLAGGSVTFFSACTYAKGKSALRWQPVRGDLITLAWHSPSEGSDYPTVHYQYAFARKSYEGSKACFGAASEATCKLRDASPGEEVTVFVNPANPSESVLLPGPSGFAKAFLGIGCGSIILGLLAVASTLPGTCTGRRDELQFRYWTSLAWRQ